MNGSRRIRNARGLCPSPLNGTVPFDVRKKIQLMLLLRHAGGCNLTKVPDEYRIYYGEDIFPQMFNFKNWVDLLKSIPEHVHVRNKEYGKWVYGHPLEQEEAIRYLGKIFDARGGDRNGLSDADLQHDILPDVLIQNGIDCNVFNREEFVEAMLSGNVPGSIEVNSVSSGSSFEDNNPRVSANTVVDDDLPENSSLVARTAPTDTEVNEAWRKRRHSVSGSCSSSSDSSATQENPGSSSQLGIESLSPTKTLAKKLKRWDISNVVPLADDTEIESERMGTSSDALLPKWYQVKDERNGLGPDYENFMNHTTKLSPDVLVRFDESDAGNFFPCGPYFPADCKINMDETTSLMALGKASDHLRCHLFWSLLPENVPGDISGIPLNNGQMLPLMNLESYQLAELDKTFGFQISQHGSPAGNQIRVISSYGNYADYFLWKRGLNSKCLGLMPYDGLDLAKLRYSPGISYENFTNFRDGLGDADIFDPETIADFERHVKSSYPGKVDVFVGSGIAYPGMRNRPEDLALVQALLALKLVREGGIFVLKIDNIASNFTVGLIFYLGQCFSKITLEKPESTLPGEKFLVCFRKLKDVRLAKVWKFFDECNKFRIRANWEVSHDYTESIIGYEDDDFDEFAVHPVELLRQMDPEFLRFIRTNNERLTQKELLMMAKVVNRYDLLVGNTSDTATKRKSDVDNLMLTERNDILLQLGLHQREKIE